MKKILIIGIFLVSGLEAFKNNYECVSTKMKMGNKSKTLTKRQAISQGYTIDFTVTDYRAYAHFPSGTEEFKYTETLKNGADIYTWEESDQVILIRGKHISMGNNELTMTTYKILPDWCKTYMSEQNLSIKLNCKTK